MKIMVRNSLLIVLLIAGCASEDPNIVNPPPGSARVLVRLLNLVPDNTDRKLILDLGYQTGYVAAGQLGDTVRAPSDSSFLEVFSTTSEFKTLQRQRFSQQSIYDIIAVTKPNSTDEGMDTIMVSNANSSLTTLPVAQVRLANAFPDTLTTFEVRIGCPNGEYLTSSAVPFRQTSLYREVAPGQGVFTIVKITSGISTVMGTFECQLIERTPYTITMYKKLGNPDPQILFFSESDFTRNAERVFVPVLARDADVRVCNVASSAVTVTLKQNNQVLAQDQQMLTTNAYAQVPTCEHEQADVFEAQFSDGKSASDSTSLVVRGKFTIVATDSAGEGRLILVTPSETVYGANGKSVVRVVHASSTLGTVAVSVGARSDVSSPNGISSGLALTQNISFDNVSGPVVLSPGELPITVGTAHAPSSLLTIGRTNLVPDHSYLFVIAKNSAGEDAVFVVDESDDAGALDEMEDGSLTRFVNGSPQKQFVTASVGSVVQNGKVYYRNSFATSVLVGDLPVSADGASNTFQSDFGKRSLIIYAIKGASEEKLIEVKSDPLRQIPGQSDRRVINATSDINFISASYDTNFRVGKETENVASDVAFGTSSAVYVLDRDRRGTMYFYDAEAKEDLYSLPIDFGPLGNSYSLLVVGSKQSGYEVIVLQEF